MKNHIWKKQGFDDFMKGTFGNGGQNLYVSKNGVLQRIHLYDVTGNGYPDMLYANSQSMGERVPMYAYRGSLKCEPKKLRTRGSYDAVMADITGDGTMDLIVACQHDGVHSDVTAMIYYGNPEGYTEKYMAEIYVPSCFSVAAGDFRGIGKRDLAFASESGLRLFEQTNLGIEPTVFRDLPLRAAGLIASDLDGDGYDDLFVTLIDGTCYVYWGGKDGINADRFTALPYTPLPICNQTTSTAGRVGFTLLSWTPAIVDIKGERCFLYIDGDKVSFISFKNRELSVVLSVNVPNATHAAVGNLTGGNDIFITVSEHMNKEAESLLLLERDGYDVEKAIRIKTRGAKTTTISPLKKGGESYLFIAQTGTRHTNDTESLAFKFNSKGEITEEYKLPCHTAMKICVGYSGHGEDYEAVVVNYESGHWSGAEDIYIYLGDERGYSPDRRIELPGLSAVEGQMIDFTDNGHPDVLVVNCAENQPSLCTGLYIYHNEGNGPDINLREDVPTPLPHGVAIGDFRHSGYLDIATGGIHSRELQIFHGGPDGYSEDRMQRIVFGSKPFKHIDWTQIDLLALSGRSGESAENIRDNGEFRWIFTADLNNDGYLDLIIPLIVGCRAFILWGGPDGFSTDNMQILATDGNGCVNVADLNGNGYPDLIFGGHISTKKKIARESYITIYWNGPDGFKENRKTMLPAWCANSVAIGDFNGDGVLDIFATSYSNGLVRDLDSYIYFGDKERGFTFDNKQQIFNNSGCGCVAGDFNFDGYIDLAVASHKKEGNHVCESYVYWGGPDGINETRRTVLPTRGVHGMTTVDIGNIMDRSDNEYYYSEAHEIEGGAVPKFADWDSTGGIRTSVSMAVRFADTEGALKDAEWSREYASGEHFDVDTNGKYMQYRLNLVAKSGCGTPRVTAVRVHFE